MDISEIIKLISDNGITIILSAVVVAFLISLLRIFNKKYLPENNNYNVTSLKNHAFISNLDYFIHCKIPTLQLGGSIRSRMFRDMLKCKLNILKRYVFDLIDKDIKDSDELQTAIINVVSNSYDDYTKAWKELGVPDIVILKTQDYCVKHNDMIKAVVIQTCNSNVFCNIFEKKVCILTLLDCIVNLFVMDLEVTFRNLNGDISKEKYNGKVIGY